MSFKKSPITNALRRAFYFHRTFLMQLHKIEGRAFTHLRVRQNKVSSVTPGTPVHHRTADVFTSLTGKPLLSTEIRTKLVVCISFLSFFFLFCY